MVQDYVSGHGSLKSISITYNIPSYQTLQDWVLRYTSGNEVKGYLPKHEMYTMKVRKTKAAPPFKVEIDAWACKSIEPKL